MKQKIIKASAVIAIISIICFVFSSCKEADNENAIIDVITLASEVGINGEKTNTVEASMGAFKGAQGDYIEFFFDEPVTFDSFFINEKIPEEMRDEILLVADGHHILWIVGMRTNCMYHVREHTKQILEIRIDGGENHGGNY